MAAPYDRITIEGIRYFICASCRRPHRPGTDAPYGFPEPGGVPIKSIKRQSLCGVCYRAAYAFMYPPRLYPNQPDVPDNALGVDPIPWDTSALEQERGPRTEQDIWDEAFALWKKEGRAGSPDDVFKRLLQEERGADAQEMITEVQLEPAGVVKVVRE